MWHLDGSTPTGVGRRTRRFTGSLRLLAAAVAGCTALALGTSSATAATPSSPNTARQPAAAATAAKGGAAVTFTPKGPVGWDTYRHLDQLPLLTKGAQTKQFSSFDRNQQNGDWWHGPNYCMRITTDSKCVVAEHSGPGEIDEIWFTANGGDVSSVGNITITLDGQVVLDAPLQDVVNGNTGAPFIYPLVGDADQSSGGVYIAVPMTFTQSMLVTTDSSDFYYHVIYRTFADANGVSTFDPNDLATDVLGKFAAAGTRDPKPKLRDTRTVSTAVNLAPGASVSLNARHGESEMTAVQVKLPQAQYVTPSVSTASGRAFGKGGHSTFTMAINPNNTGVQLVRRLDPSIANQVASVAVNGTIVGQWGPSAASPAMLAERSAAKMWPAGTANAAQPSGQWAYETVNLPASATAGLSQITITNTFVSSSLDFNEFTYWANSVVNGTPTTTDTLQVGDATSEAAHNYKIVNQTWSGTRTFTEPLSAQQLAELTTAQQLLQNIRLQISFDGRTTVDSPLGEFFGSGFGVESVKSLMFSMIPGGWYSAWWPMPYLRNATVRLVNNSSIAVTGAQLQLSSAPDRRIASGLRNGTVGYFRTSSAAGPTTPNQDWAYLQASGSGKFVGDTVDMTGPVSRGYLEGNERVYTNGLSTPQIIGTGTEDFYESGWYFNRGPYSAPLHGNAAHFSNGSGCAVGSDCTGAWRLYLAQAVSFGNGITFGIQHGGENDISANYSSTAYWYGAATSQPSLRQSDALTIGDPASEAAHDYTSTDPGAVTSLTETYEGVDGPQHPITMNTRATTAPVSFQLNVSGASGGAVLVRTSDQQNAYQDVQVSVDGVSLPDWVEPLSNPYHQWLDDTYQLPASVTAGRSTVTVTLTPVSGSPAWSAASYKVLVAR